MVVNIVDDHPKSDEEILHVASSLVKLQLHDEPDVIIEEETIIQPHTKFHNKMQRCGENVRVKMKLKSIPNRSSQSKCSATRKPSNKIKSHDKYKNNRLSSQKENSDIELTSFHRLAELLKASFKRLKIQFKLKSSEQRDNVTQSYNMARAVVNSLIMEAAQNNDANSLNDKPIIMEELPELGAAPAQKKKKVDKRKRWRNKRTANGGAQNNRIEELTKKFVYNKNIRKKPTQHSANHARQIRQKLKQKPETIVREEHRLRMYINAIVRTFIHEQFGIPRSHMNQFYGSVCDLEAYANRLVRDEFGRIIEGPIRVNRFNNNQGFISLPGTLDKPERDGIILNIIARQYAMEGDIVRAFIFNTIQTIDHIDDENSLDSSNVVPEADEKEKFSDEFDVDEAVGDIEISQLMINNLLPGNCPKAFVISILQKVNRVTVGLICTKVILKMDGATFYKVKPTDPRLPFIYVPNDEKTSAIIGSSGPNDESSVDKLVMLQIIENSEIGNRIGELIKLIGKEGELNAEVEAILIKNHITYTHSYDERFEKIFRKPDPISIWEKESKYREDLRNKCIFTIDPLTARDLDDAISITQLKDNIFEIGVHIADVSLYLDENSELDNLVKERATSVYLPTEVIQMLPESLTKKCSLLPGEDKYAMSVFWVTDKNAETIGEPRFMRTTINSCGQFAYEHIQCMIDHPDDYADKMNFPAVHNGFTITDIAERISMLHGLTSNMRKRRFENGAVSIDNIKIHLIIDETTGKPTGFIQEERTDANFLIEELMLLANQYVARFIYKSFPKISILRCHPPPVMNSIKEICDRFKTMTFQLDYTSSRTIYASIQNAVNSVDEKYRDAARAALSNIITKPMARAVYFCSEGKTKKKNFWHFALNIPIYTHFTSPIRRYADILVHRVLAAALHYHQPPQRSPAELHELAKHCNKQKYNAKLASDDVNMIYFINYVQSQGFVMLQCVVTELTNANATVVSLSTGYKLTINYKTSTLKIDLMHLPQAIMLKEQKSKKKPKIVSLLSVINVRVTVENNKLEAYFISPDPEQNRKNLSKKKHNDLPIKRPLHAMAHSDSDDSILAHERDFLNSGRNVFAEEGILSLQRLGVTVGSSIAVKEAKKRKKKRVRQKIAAQKKLDIIEKEKKKHGERRLSNKYEELDQEDDTEACDTNLAIPTGKGERKINDGRGSGANVTGQKLRYPTVYKGKTKKRH